MLSISLNAFGSLWWKKRILLCGVISGIMLFSYSVNASESSIPWQCTSYTYTGNSQEECIQSLKNDQQEKIARLERQLKHQEIALIELNQKLDRQMRRSQQDVQAFSPTYGYAPPPLFGNPLIPQYGYGAPFGFGIGPLPFLPSIGIVID